VDAALDKDKTLFHQLQCLGSLNAQIIEQARTRLTVLLSRVVAQAADAKLGSILGIKDFDDQLLASFMSELSAQTTTAWTAYLTRRRNGGPRELLHTRKHAVQWLEHAAPVKLVDGAWLSRQLHELTPAHLKPISRIMWQIFAEELGDGILARNHVYLYQQLLQHCGSNLPRSDSQDFIDPRLNPNDDASVWAASTAQLCLGLFPTEFLPEVLGFTLAYECVSLETLLCAHELEELGLDARYFKLHITIDNADSGHTAMAFHAVVKFMQQPEGCAASDSHQQRWRRIQAGFLLATELPFSPKPHTSAELKVLQIFSNKLAYGHAAHMTCRSIIGDPVGNLRLNLNSWLDVELWDERKSRFLRALSHSRWIVRGNAQQSRFVSEMAWGGRMFGAFTAKEKAAIEQWIDGLEDNPTAIEDHPTNKLYLEFVGHDTHSNMQTQPPSNSLELGAVDPFRFPVLLRTLSSEPSPAPAMTVRGMAHLLHNSVVPLQHALSSPLKAASIEGMAILRILRAMNGFSKIPDADAVDGMDEVSHPSRSGLAEIAEMLYQSTLDAQETNRSGEQSLAGDLITWSWLRQLSLDPEFNMLFLLGVLRGLIDCAVTNMSLLENSLLPDGIANNLDSICAVVAEELTALCVEERHEFQLGYNFVRSQVGCV
jgi:predicted hotdog family 3-hydroxylacyl-ACP dehydratase